MSDPLNNDSLTKGFTTQTHCVSTAAGYHVTPTGGYPCLEFVLKFFIGLRKFFQFFPQLHYLLLLLK